MLKNPNWSRHSAVRQTAASAMILAVGALLASTNPALAENPAQIKEMSFSTQAVYNQAIRVVSSDNKKWDSIKPGSVSFGAHVMIDTRNYGFIKGWVMNVGIVLGPCYGSSCLNKPLLWSAIPVTKDWRSRSRRAKSRLPSGTRRTCRSAKSSSTNVMRRSHQTVASATASSGSFRSRLSRTRRWD